MHWDSRFSQCHAFSPSFFLSRSVSRFWEHLVISPQQPLPFSTLAKYFITFYVGWGLQKKKKLHTNEYLMWNIDDAALGICAHWRNFAAIFSPFPPPPRIACFVPATNDTMAAHTASVFWSLNNRYTKTNNNKKMTAICSQQLIRLKRIIPVFIFLEFPFTRLPSLSRSLSLMISRVSLHCTSSEWGGIAFNLYPLLNERF